MLEQEVCACPPALGTHSQVADIICPNVLELEMLSGVSIKSFDDVVVAARALLARGPSFVLVKHLGMFHNGDSLLQIKCAFEICS